MSFTEKKHDPQPETQQPDEAEPAP